MLKAAMTLALIHTAAMHTDSVGKVTNVATHLGQFDKVLVTLLPVLLMYA